MANTVHCRKYGEELPALTTPPFPGPAGEKIMETVSAKAWDEWLAHQKRLINEKHLELFDPNTRTYLQEQMILFFKNDDFDKASGYTAEKPES